MPRHLHQWASWRGYLGLHGALHISLTKVATTALVHYQSYSLTIERVLVEDHVEGEFWTELCRLDDTPRLRRIVWVTLFSLFLEPISGGLQELLRGLFYIGGQQESYCEGYSKSQFITSLRSPH